VSKIKLLLNVVEDLRSLADSIQTITKAVEGGKTHLTQGEEIVSTPQEITLEEVRVKLAALMQSGKQAEVKQLLQKHGGNKLSDVPKENYPALLKDAEAV
jgi:hypothetical protein